jgi:hypothetical protein
MNNTYNNITLKPLSQVFNATNYQMSGSFVPDPNFTQQGSLVYKPLQGAFYAQLKPYTGDNLNSDVELSTYSPDNNPNINYKTFRGEIFSMELSENEPEVKIPPYDNTAGANELLPPNKAIYSPVSCRLEGLVYNNNFVFQSNPNNLTIRNVEVSDTDIGGGTFINTIPASSVAFNDVLCLLYLDGSPGFDPMAYSPTNTYFSFTPGLIKVQQLNENADDVLDPEASFYASVFLYDPTTQLLLFQPVDIPTQGFAPQGEWGGGDGLTNWLITNETSPTSAPEFDPIQLTNPLHFEMQHSVTPSNGNMMNELGLNFPVGAIGTGNNLQGTAFIPNQTAPSNFESQCTYRKFWYGIPQSPDYGILGDEVTTPANDFLPGISIASPSGQLDKAFTLAYNEYSNSWYLQGSFLEGSNPIVRGTYLIY